VLFQHTLDAINGLLAQAPPPTPSTSTTPPADGDTIINTNEIIGWAARAIVPLILCVTGAWAMNRARRGRVSEVVTASGISLLGVFLFVGAGAFLLVGDKLVNLVLK
jgi:hypothetical protein